MSQSYAESDVARRRHASTQRRARRPSSPPSSPATAPSRRADVAEYALWLGDDALILAQQLGWWIARAPELEEDVALGNIALDLLGHARSLLHYAGTATGRSEDDLAYWRDEPEFRSAWLFEQPNGDFAHTIARQLVRGAPTCSSSTRALRRVDRRDARRDRREVA